MNVFFKRSFWKKIFLTFYVPSIGIAIMGTAFSIFGVFYDNYLIETGSECYGELFTQAYNSATVTTDNKKEFDFSDDEARKKCNLISGYGDSDSYVSGILGKYIVSNYAKKNSLVMYENTGIILAILWGWVAFLFFFKKWLVWILRNDSSDLS